MDNAKEILQLIQEEKWEEAATVVSDRIKAGIYDDTIAVLAATINEHFGDTETFLLNVETGLKYNYENYELYLMLGNYYAIDNCNQAFLCYENAEYYCRKKGNPEDLNYICQVKQNLLDTGNVTVVPYSFVILSYNTLEMTKECIESIRQTCNPDSYELIVIDNASEDGSLDWLRRQNDILLIENTENVGFPAGCNQGIAAAKPDHDIMLLNSDTVMMPNAMFTLRMGLYDSDKNGAAGAVSNNADNQQTIDSVFNGIEEYRQFAAKNNIHCRAAYEKKVWLIGFALLLRRTALEQAGFLDERFTPGNFEDNDLGIRFMQKGFCNVLCWDSFIYHYGGKSFDKLKSRKHSDLMQINMRKYEEKWGISPAYYMNAREDLMQFIKHDKESRISVLEIGCGAGVTLGRIAYQYPNADVHGIESLKEAADLGAVNFDITHGNIETMELPYAKGSFDYIIMGNVLENAVTPELVLDKIRHYLKKKGYVICSMPNLMNAKVIYNLLKGISPYTEKTVTVIPPLRYFTYQEIQDLFEKAGYHIEQILGLSLGGYTTDDYKEIFDYLLSLDGVAEKNQFDIYQYNIRLTLS